MKYIPMILCSLLLPARFTFAADEARKLVTVVDYIGGDYKNAVQAGKVLQQQEYQEMKEFSLRSLELAKELKTAGKDDVVQSVNRLAALIDQ